MSYDDLRTGRHSSHGQVYLVTTVTEGRQPFFLDFTLARRVIAEMRHCHTTGRVNSLAWVLMPDHLHWLFQLGDAGTLGEVMQSFKGRSARAINLIAGFNERSAQVDDFMGRRQRGIWQRSYHDHALRAEDDVRSVARYLAANPLRAGLVKELGAYSHWDAVWV